MADLVIGATVEVVLEKLLSLTIEEARSLRNCKKNLRILTKYVSMIQAFIHDAERQQVDDQAVEEWLRMLERVAEDAENVFDEMTYESLKAQVMKIRTKLVEKATLPHQKSVSERKFSRFPACHMSGACTVQISRLYHEIIKGIHERCPLNSVFMDSARRLLWYKDKSYVSLHSHASEVVVML